MSQRNEIFIFFACQEHKHTKKFLLIGYIPSSLDCFSVTKKLQRVFSRTLQIGNVQFYRKLKYANLVKRNSMVTHCLIARRGPDVFVYTSSSVAFFLMQREKSTVIFPTHFICVWLRTCFNNFFMTWAHKEFAWPVVEFNRKYMKLTKCFHDFST